jgi:hypothetical protein
MTRDEILQFGLEAAKDEYLRLQGRIGLVETKSQLVSATAGILLGVLVVLGEHLPHSTAAQVLLLAVSVMALLLSLLYSIKASLIVDIRSPESAAQACAKCEELIGVVGNTGAVVDPKKAEIVVGNTCGSYLSASKETAILLGSRMRDLRVSQIALLIGILCALTLVGLPLLRDMFIFMNSGGRQDG